MSHSPHHFISPAKRYLVAVTENLWDNYAVSSRQLESDRTSNSHHARRVFERIGVYIMSKIEGWKTGRLGELSSIEIGGTPSRNEPTFWDSAKESSNVWVSIRDLSRSVINTTSEHLSDAGVRNSNVKLQAPGTVLLSFKLSIGRVAFAGVPLFTNEAIAGLRSEKIDHTYLYHGLQHWDLLQGVDQAIKGATLSI